MKVNASQSRHEKRYAGWRSRWDEPPGPLLLYFAAVLAANEALTNSGAGLSPAKTLVGVTGFEPAASSSRTTSKVVANGR